LFWWNALSYLGFSQRFGPEQFGRGNRCCGREAPVKVVLVEWFIAGTLIFIPPELIFEAMAARVF
jgi:hypothetical protein